jgi:hypothetical protein
MNMRTNALEEQVSIDFAEYEIAKKTLYNTDQERKQNINQKKYKFEQSYKTLLLE